MTIAELPTTEVKDAVSVLVPSVPVVDPGAAAAPQLPPAPPVLQLSFAPAPDHVALAAWAVNPDNSARASAAHKVRSRR